MPLRAAFVAATLLLAVPLTHAAPDNAPDAMAQLLRDKGLIDPSFIEQARKMTAIDAPALGRQVRNATSNLVVSAMGLIGVPYKHGGNSSETGFDCSGFTRYIFENSIGLLLPRKVDEQAKASTLVPVKRSELQPGDLVFFNTLRRTFSHVGIYVGDDKFIHAPRTGGEIRIESLSVRYWAKRFTGGRRATQAADADSDNAAAALVPAQAAPASVGMASPLALSPDAKREP